MASHPPPRFIRFAIGVAVAALAVAPAPAAAATPHHAPPSAGGDSPVAGVRVLAGTLADGATYRIDVPPHWNHTLFLYSHPYVIAGTPNPARDAGDPFTGHWMLSHGFALAGSSYASTGWAVQQALPDQIATLGVFARLVGHPRQTIAWGHSLGGMITAGLIQDYPGRFTAALPMCGVLSGGVAVWNTSLDAGFAIKTLLVPSLQLVHITDPAANLAAAEQAVAAAQQTAQGRARLALAAALADLPGWFTPLSVEPAATDFTAQEANQFLGLSDVTVPATLELRPDLEAHAGGNPSWNTGVNYASDLARSAGAREVRALHRAAHLSLSGDLAALAAGPRISAEKNALRYLTRFITFNGELGVPVLSMQTTGDPSVVPESDQAYRSVVHRVGDTGLLRETFVHRAGHCSFTPAETIAAVQVLMRRLGTGHWDATALTPQALNARAAALGPVYNVFPDSSGKLVHTPPAYQSYRPAPYPRPFSQPAR